MAFWAARYLLEGDLISNCSSLSIWKTFLAMIAFEFFGIDQAGFDVPIEFIDIQSWIRIWISNQGYAWILSGESVSI